MGPVVDGMGAPLETAMGDSIVEFRLSNVECCGEEQWELMTLTVVVEEPVV